MRTIYLKSQPNNPWMTPTYIKISGVDNDIKKLEVWRSESCELSNIDDETFSELLNRVYKQNNALEIDKKEFDEQYLKFANNLNQLASV